MLKFSEYITESFDNPYNYKWIRQPDWKNLKRDFAASFTAKSGKIIFQMMKSGRPDSGSWEVDFVDSNYNYKMNGGGDSFRIMATILMLIGDSIEKAQEMELPIERVFFTADKEQDEMGKTGRASLYSKMAKKYGTRYGTVSVRDMAHELSITIKVK